MRAFILAVVVLTAAGAEADDKACLGCHAVIQTILSKSNAHPAMALGCQPCHTDHTQSAAAGPAHHLKSPPQELCVTCHPEKTKKEFVHEPAKRECTICHSPHEGLKDGLRAQSNALCLECHSDASKSKFETSGPAKLFDGHVTLPAQYFGSLPLLALQNDRGHPVSNHPVLREQDTEWPAVSCTVCHDPHGADKSAALLVTETLDFVDLCQRCHK